MCAKEYEITILIDGKRITDYFTDFHPSEAEKQAKNFYADQYKVPAYMVYILSCYQITFNK